MHANQIQKLNLIPSQKNQQNYFQSIFDSLYLYFFLNFLFFGSANFPSSVMQDGGGAVRAPGPILNFNQALIWSQFCAAVEWHLFKLLSNTKGEVFEK